MTQQPPAPNYLKALGILYTAMLSGQIIFAALALVLVYTGNFSSIMPEAESIFFILVPALIISARLGGTAMFKKKIKEALNAGTTTEKLTLYRSVFITRCALLEGSVLFAIITYLLTNNIALLVFAAGGLFLFYLLKPTKEKVVIGLQLSGEEAATIT